MFYTLIYEFFGGFVNSSLIKKLSEVSPLMLCLEKQMRNRQENLIVLRQKSRDRGILKDS